MKVLVNIELEIEAPDDDGSPQAVFGLVDGLLDAGFFQDAINDHEEDDVPDLKVVSALCRPGAPERST